MVVYTEYLKIKVEVCIALGRERERGGEGGREGGREGENLANWRFCVANTKF